MEYGLCEMMNSLAVRPNVAPKDGIFSFDISQCESVLPAGTIDNTTEMVYKEVILCFHLLSTLQYDPVAVQLSYDKTRFCL